jgi:hypothetical protein
MGSSGVKTGLKRGDLARIKDEPHPIWGLAVIIFVDEKKGVAGVKLFQGADEIALDRLEKIEKD